MKTKIVGTEKIHNKSDHYRNPRSVCDHWRKYITTVQVKRRKHYLLNLRLRRIPFRQHTTFQDTLDTHKGIIFKYYYSIRLIRRLTLFCRCFLFFNLHKNTYLLTSFSDLVCIVYIDRLHFSALWLFFSMNIEKLIFSIN